ncbi:uncharacterized protein LOC111698965 isoform X2 [Eurytemora carolleeae]|uniref:uncharacterized protein LOC111698965 isoform X2 n=1 Tax=Eurytemora carolleeae TaxID=1294199 RepID=UPI000C7619F2|nr:uncharacterized protein LOC111698965 isoform X2 [Eurytemora carolleeae]|eukprot:XP_023325237.1 uncharacterized protein LOC111698965 isoform X2 [Eurytemora affinis]
MKQYANKRMTEDFLLSGQLGSLCVGVTVMIIMSSKLMEDVFLVVQKKAKLFVLILKEMLNVFVIQTYTLWKSKENVIRTLRRLEISELYADWKYQNSTQGICSPGYNMEILRKDEYVCRKNDCQLPNEQLWSDGKCYEKRTEKCSRGLFFILERDKKTSKLVLQGIERCGELIWFGKLLHGKYINGNIRPLILKTFSSMISLDCKTDIS